MMIFVTGATGLIGRALCKDLCSRGYNVKDTSRNGSVSVDGATIVQCDLLNVSVEELAALMGGATTVFHCAGEKTDARRFEDMNVGVTEKVVAAANIAAVLNIIHFSSVSAFGPDLAGIVDEETACHPLTPYEKSKFGGEMIVRVHSRAAKKIVLRPTHVFSAANLADALPKGRAKEILKGREIAHLVFSQDVVAAAVHLMEADVESGVYIVSTDDLGSGPIDFVGLA